MPPSPPPARHGWTLDQLAALPDDDLRYELVDGSLLVSPPASQSHQGLGHALADVLRRSAPEGWRCLTEFPLPFADDRLRVPDVVAHRWPPRHPREDPDNPVGPADVGLVVEVVSRSTRRTDRFAKPGEYAEAGIAVFWRVETDPVATLHPYVLRGGAYEAVAPVTGTGVAPTPWGEVAVDLTADRVS